MAKASKATKKFQNKHLKHTLDHRKKVQKYNKTHGKKKLPVNSDATDKRESKATREVFEDMSVDDFLSGDFEVPKKKHSRGKEQDIDDNDSSSSEDEEQMKQDLENLAEKDPEFYKYLQNNDKDLLEYEGVNPLDAISDDEEELSSEEAPNANIVKDTPQETEKVELTSSLVKKWGKELDEPSSKLIRNISIAFKAAINVNRANEEDYKYAVTDPTAFHELMMLTLKKLPTAIQKLVKYKVNPQTGARSLPQSKNATQMSSILKSHAGSYITLLKDITNTDTAVLVLASLREILPYYVSHRRLLKDIFSSVVNVWSSTVDIETQIAAFAFMNNSAKEYKKSVLEMILRLMYSTFLKNCRKTNIYTMPMINFCKNAAADLFGVDENLSYQIGFEYIRQLAIHLRNSINATSNAKEGYKTIYNWQYCHSLDFWSRVISQLCNPERESLAHKSKESPLRQLIYPLVQVTLGTIRLIPSAQFFPLRFYLIRSLIRMSQSTGVYIPIFPLISEILTSTAITKAPKSSSLQAVDFEHAIKVNQAYLGTRVYQTGLCEQFVELTGEFFVLYSKNIAFPELVTPAVLLLRRFLKKSKNMKFNKQLQQLVEKLNTNARFITEKRANVEYGPSNRAEVQLFLKDFDWEKTPLGQYVVVQRKLKDEKMRILREAVAEEEKAREQKEKDDEEEEIEMADLENDESELEEDK
ncbi:uncharacterized protein PRCAT00000450001 [Priceomyces carsonii]|uniref:uncharacterized protein n=1 Tax=Priceomyces carsonii TaxID=28549 RepID=UPI002EDA337C|nr:unnamed protein product [Priceomyces carsonii]